MTTPRGANTTYAAVLNQRIADALHLVSDTRELQLGAGVIGRAAEVFQRQFPNSPAVIVADRNTLAAAGQQVLALLKQAGVPTTDPIVFDEPDLPAEYQHVDRIQATLSATGAVPVAVGSGTINDLTKLAGHLCGRPYLVVATAASMDGYTACGASITRYGSKETFWCPAPRAVIADLDVICRAPTELNIAGYADLVAKTTAGADWILADAAGIEPIDPRAWELVQTHLREWIGDPAGVQRGQPAALHALTEGLLMSGLAIQHNRSSRPASGAEHQFSHLWDMEQHRHQGRVPWHGCKVGIGTLAVTLLYEELLRFSLEQLDIQRVCAQQPDLPAVQRSVCETHTQPELREIALREVAAKHRAGPALEEMLSRLRAAWPQLRTRLRQQLLGFKELHALLRRAGAPCEPEAISIDWLRLRRSYLAAQQIRRRFTVLDLAVLTGLLPACLDRLFAPVGPWRAGPGLSPEGGR